MNDVCVPAELVEALREVVNLSRRVGMRDYRIREAARALVDAVERPSEPTSISDEAEADDYPTHEQRMEGCSAYAEAHASDEAEAWEAVLNLLDEYCTAGCCQFAETNEKQLHDRLREIVTEYHAARQEEA